MENQVADINYERVIPRDLFNEAKLLKCLGRLILLIHEKKTPCRMLHNEPDKFIIGMLPEGSLVVTNLVICIGRKPFLFKTTYNNKNPYPLFVEHESTEYLVFDENGEWDVEFIGLINYVLKLK